MCLSCDNEPCSSNCPEAYGFPKSVCICSYCNDTVYKGDGVRMLDGGFYVFHEECMSEMRADEFADFQGIETEII